MRLSYRETRPQLLLMTRWYPLPRPWRMPAQTGYRSGDSRRGQQPNYSWRVSVLAGGESRFRDDDGSAEPLAAAALAAFGTGTGHAALTSLARSRLLVPVVAVESDGPGESTGEARGGKSGAEKYSEMS